MITSQVDNHEETEKLRARLAEAEDMLRAIQQGEIDALVVEGADGPQIYTLHSAEEPYRNLVEEMQEGAVVLTRRGDIHYANARFAALVGEPLESVVGSRIDRYVDTSDRPHLESLLSCGIGRRRVRLIGSDSGAFDVGLSLNTLSSTHGRRMTLIVTDLRELLEANTSRERAERASSAKDEFLTMLAHELRTPLSAIGNAVRVLELTRPKGAPAARARKVISRQVRQMAHLIDALLDVERVVSGEIHLNRQPIDMAETVRQAVAAFTGDSRLDRQIDLTTEPVWVEGDAVRLEQILTNIVTNAVKYTPSGGQIRVALRAEGSDAVLTVDDMGSGISVGLLPFIFDKYVQADRTLDRAQGGLGIGLTMVKRLVTLHGGTIVASSEGEGHGTSFTVRLKQIPSVTEAPDLAFPLEQRVKPRRVLLIEDSADARDMLRMMLELAGHAVYDAADGIRGLELLNIVHPDVGIIDIGLPGMDGYQIAKQIREKPQGRDMLLMALTGYDSPGDADRSSEHGFDYHLVKPVDPDQLAHLLSEGARAS